MSERHNQRFDAPNAQLISLRYDAADVENRAGTFKYLDVVVSHAHSPKCVSPGKDPLCVARIAAFERNLAFRGSELAGGHASNGVCPEVTEFTRFFRRAFTQAVFDFIPNEFRFFFFDWEPKIPVCSLPHEHFDTCFVKGWIGKRNHDFEKRWKTIYWKAYVDHYQQVIQLWNEDPVGREAKTREDGLCCERAHAHTAECFDSVTRWAQRENGRSALTLNPNRTIKDRNELVYVARCGHQHEKACFTIVPESFADGVRIPKHEQRVCEHQHERKCFVQMERATIEAAIVPPEKLLPRCGKVHLHSTECFYGPDVPPPAKEYDGIVAKTEEALTPVVAVPTPGGRENPKSLRKETEYTIAIPDTDALSPRAKALDDRSLWEQNMREATQPTIPTPVGYPLLEVARDVLRVAPVGMAI